jgi:hypothetical protein
MPHARIVLIINIPIISSLVQVDATEERSLGERFNVGGYPTLKIFTHGSDKPVDYEGERDDVMIRHVCGIFFASKLK